MNISTCLNPRIIRDKNEKFLYVVPCGKCEVCRNRASSTWVQRLNAESLCWKYQMFVTLTYSDANLPKLDPVSQYEYADLNTGVCITLDTNQFDPKFLKKRKCIPYVSVRDLQLFIKRLRYYAEKEIKDHKLEESPRIRYYACAEYGPSTCRPHYHLLLWFNSDYVFRHFDSIVHSSWNLGIVDFSPARNCASYVARYVTCLAHLPSVYKHKSLRPFSLCSRFPPLGTLEIPTKEIFEIWNRGLVTRALYDPERKAICDVPLWRSLQARLFPKIRGFSQISHFNRVTLYGVAKQFPKESFEEWRDSFVTYYEDLIYSTGLRWKSDYLSFVVQLLSDNYRSKDDSVLRNLYQISKRVLKQCDVFCCTLDYYVSRIEDYYSHLDYYNLIKQLNYEVDLATRFGPQMLVNLDPVFVQRCSFVDGNQFALADWEISTLEGFGIDPLRFCTDKVYRDLLDVHKCPDYMKMSADALRLFAKNTKTKRKNDYLSLHPDKIYF